MSFRFIHISDVHLDTPFLSRNKDLRAFLRESIREAFKTGVDLAIEKRVNAILIAGDLFDNDSLSFNTESFLMDQIKRMEQANIQMLYAPGNHDPYGIEYRLSRIPWLTNVHIFNSYNASTCTVLNEEGKAIGLVSGAGHEHSKESRNLTNYFQKAEEGLPHVGLLHTMVSETAGNTEHERYAPCTLSDLLKKDYLYWALGHVHKRTELKDEKSMVNYPGNLMGRNPLESGPKGGYFVSIDNSKNVYKEFHILSPICWDTVEVNSLADVKNLNELTNKLRIQINKYLEMKHYRGKILLRVILSGPCPLINELHIDENIHTLIEILKNELGIYHIEIKIQGIIGVIDPNKYKKQVHVLSTALGLIEDIEKDDKLLIKFMPEVLAGCNIADGREQKIKYMRELLMDLDYEIACRMLVGSNNED